MANDCLVTKLKSTVQDSNLVKLGDCRVNMVINNTTVLLQPTASINETVKVKIIDGPAGAKLINNLTSEQATEFTVTNGSLQLLFSATGNYVIELGNFYGIVAFKMDRRNTPGIDTTKFGCMSNLFSISSAIYGDIKYLPDSIIIFEVNQTAYDVSEYALTGDLSEFKARNSCRVLKIVKSLMTGSLDDIALNTVMTDFVWEQSGALTGNLSSFLNKPALKNIQLYNNEVAGNINIFLNNGALTLPALELLAITNCPNITANSADIEALRNLGVTVIYS